MKAPFALSRREQRVDLKVSDSLISYTFETIIFMLFPSMYQDITTAIQRDADNVNLDAVCAHSDSYNVGKAIGLVARLASISR